MLRQERSRPFDAVDEGRRKISALEASTHGQREFIPEFGAAFLVDATVADDGECAGARGDEDEDRISVPRVRHPKFVEMAPRGRDRVGRPVSGDENAYLPGGVLFGHPNRLHDFVVVDLGGGGENPAHGGCPHQDPPAPPPPKLPPPPENPPPPEKPPPPPENPPMPPVKIHGLPPQELTLPPLW